MKSRSIFLMLFFAIFILSCKETKIEKSEVLSENAVVVNKVFTPSRHDVKLKIVDPNFDFGFEPSIKLTKNLKITSSEIPEKYATFFRCQHGGFVIERKTVFDQFNEGDSVIVYYQEIYRSEYDEKDENGERELLSRVLIDLDFLNATLTGAKVPEYYNR